MTVGPALFDRYWDLQIGTVRISSIAQARGEEQHTIKFSIEKTERRQPNNCSFQIINLSDNDRSSIESDSVVVFYAGHIDFFGSIFTGKVDKINDQKTGVDRVTTIKVLDGGQSYRNSRVNSSFSANTPVIDVFRYAVSQLGVGEGNTTSFESDIKLRNGSNVYVSGTTLYGLARGYIERIVRASDLRWSIQDGNIQLRRRDEPVNSEAVLLSEQSGLIGSPEVQQKARGRARPKVLARSILQPSLYVGRVVELLSETVNGAYQIESVKYTGSNNSNEWYADLTLKQY